MATFSFKTLSEATSADYIGEGSTVNVGADLTFLVETGKSGNNVTIHQIGATGKYLVLKRGELPEAAGMIGDAREFTFSINAGNTVTATASVFTPEDIGKTITSDRSVDKTALIEAYVNYQGNVANHTALLALGGLTNDDVYRVDDQTDDPNYTLVEDTVGTIGYYHWNTSTNSAGDRWITLDRYGRGAWTITGYTSSTEVTVDYTSPVALSNLNGIVGTNNTTNMNTLLNFLTTQELVHAHFNGQYLMVLDNNTVYSYSSAISKCNISLTGSGKKLTQLMFRLESDDLTNGDLQSADGEFGYMLNFTQLAQPASNKMNIEVANMTLSGAPRVTWRNIGEDRGRIFSAQGLTGASLNMESVTFRNVDSISSGDGFYLQAGDCRLINCDLNGLYQAESGISQFGQAELQMIGGSVNFYGTHNDRRSRYLTPNNGRPLYLHPQLKSEFTNTEFKNSHGLIQHFSGGGADELSNQTKAIYHNCKFLQDSSGPWQTAFLGVYTSRVHHTKFIGCLFANSSSITFFSMLSAAGFSLDNCDFIHCYNAWNRTNVGTNNVYYGDTEHVYITNCRFINTRMDYYDSTSGMPFIEYIHRDCVHTVTSTTGFSDVHRLHSQGAGGKRTKLKFYNNKFQGVNPGTATTSGWFFTEPGSGNGWDLEFYKCEFTSVHTPDTGVTTLSREFRLDTTMYFEECYSPNQIYIDNNNNADNNLISGKNNNFEGGLDVAQLTTTHNFQLNTELTYGTTLTAASTIAITDWNEGTFNMSGTTVVNNFLFSGSEPERYVISGKVIVYASGNMLTFGTSGNINISAPVYVFNGGNIVFDYDSTTQQFSIVEINQPNPAYVTYTTTGNIAIDDRLIKIDASSGAVTRTLPDATTNNGRVFEIKCIDATNTVTIDTAGGNMLTSTTIGGVASKNLGTNDNMIVRSDGTNYVEI